MWTNNRRFGEVLSRDRRERAAAGKLTRCRLYGHVVRYQLSRSFTVDRRGRYSETTGGTHTISEFRVDTSGDGPCLQPLKSAVGNCD
jgi:hypothetical protein